MTDRIGLHFGFDGLRGVSGNMRFGGWPGIYRILSANLFIERKRKHGRQAIMENFVMDQSWLCFVANLNAGVRCARNSAIVGDPIVYQARSTLSLNNHARPEIGVEIARDNQWMGVARNSHSTLHCAGDFNIFGLNR